MKDWEKTWLQRAVMVLALIPVATGLFGVMFGPAITGDRVSVSADSHFRYLSGMLLGLGLCFWGCVPHIEERTTPFRILTLIVVIGGLGRLTGLVLTGIPSLAMLGGLFMELVVTPVLCFWQARIAHKHADEVGVEDLNT